MIIVLSQLTQTAVKYFWQVIDRITDAGQCDYHEVIIEVINQGLLDNCLKWIHYRLTVN